MKSTLLLFVLLFGSVLLHAQSTRIDRPAFALEFPASWTIDTKDPDYDPDALFSLDADENNLVMFVILDAKVEPKLLLDTQQEALKEKVMKKPDSVTSFSRWGAYEGQGLEMKGKLLGVFPGTIRIFSYNHEDKTLLVVSQCLNSDLKKLEAGLKLVESSFRFKEAKK